MRLNSLKYDKLRDSLDRAYYLEHQLKALLVISESSEKKLSFETELLKLRETIATLQDEVAKYNQKASKKSFWATLFWFLPLNKKKLKANPFNQLTNKDTPAHFKAATIKLTSLKSDKTTVVLGKLGYEIGDSKNPTDLSNRAIEPDEIVSNFPSKAAINSAYLSNLNEVFSKQQEINELFPDVQNRLIILSKKDSQISFDTVEKLRNITLKIVWLSEEIEHSINSDSDIKIFFDENQHKPVFVNVRNLSIHNSGLKSCEQVVINNFNNTKEDRSNFKMIHETLKQLREINQKQVDAFSKQLT
jgi:hypothetical protein